MSSLVNSYNVFQVCLSFGFFLSLDNAGLREKEERVKKMVDMWSISPTFYERICVNILEPQKFKTLQCVSQILIKVAS
jgi:hypothetical protein